MTIEDWYGCACEDAARRGLPALKPLLDALAAAARELRSVDWDGIEVPGPHGGGVLDRRGAADGRADEGGSAGTGAAAGARP